LFKMGLRVVVETVYTFQNHQDRPKNFVEFLLLKVFTAVVMRAFTTHSKQVTNGYKT
jgi:hypothetical protein